MDNFFGCFKKFHFLFFFRRFLFQHKQEVIGKESDSRKRQKIPLEYRFPIEIGFCLKLSVYIYILSLVSNPIFLYFPIEKRFL